MSTAKTVSTSRFVSVLSQFLATEGAVFFYLATGTLSLLVMYVLTNVAAARHLGRDSLLRSYAGLRRADRRFRPVSHCLADTAPAVPVLSLSGAGMAPHRADHHRCH